ncbi:hypothetical protein VKT23_020042 [Stygiomarasmius scandens]|uniref:glutathione transferase n=1 Tax=Marasmiellus scandens TaxID=2682957 RepID=A0ABR1ILX4_9AGAR
MVLKLYGYPRSPCTCRVAVVLYEKKIPYELVNIELIKGEHKNPTYLEKHPFGEIPYIDDDGLILYESRAICRYLEAKWSNKGSKLVPSPSDLKAYALYEQAASIETSNFDPFASKAVSQAIFNPLFRGLPKDQVQYEEALKTLSLKLDGYEKILSKQKYLAGNEITLIDLFHLPYGSLLTEAGSDLMTTKGPNLTRWWNDITSRGSWQAVKDGLTTGVVNFN